MGRMEKQNQLPIGVRVLVGIGIALAPALIFIGQEARMYMAYLFFVWASFFLFLKVLEDPFHIPTVLSWIVVNQMLLWTHHIGIIIWATELLLLFILQVRRGNYLKWALGLITIHGFFLIPWLVWIVTIPPQPGELHRYYLKPSFWQLLTFPFFLNWVGKGGICPIGIARPWQYSMTGWGSFLHYSQSGFEFAMVLLSVLGFLGLLLGSIRSWKERKLSVVLFMLGLFVIPLFLLFVLARLGPPVFTTRYIVFLLPLHFIGIGFLISQRKKIYFVCLSTLLVIVFLYQIGVMRESAWRMDWKGVGRTIDEYSGPQDLVIVHDPFWTPIFKLNNSNFSVPVTDAYTETGLVDLSRAYFNSLNLQRRKGVNVWLVVPDIFEAGLGNIPEILQKYNLPFFVRVFPGEQKIYLYQISAPTHIVKQNFFTIWIDTKRILMRLFKDDSHRVEMFYKQHRYDPDRTSFHFIRCALELSRQKKYKEAGYLLHYAWEQNPNQLLPFYEYFGKTVNFEDVCDISIGVPREVNVVSLLWKGTECFTQKDYKGAQFYFSKLTNECPDEPLFVWLLAQTYDRLNELENSNWAWVQLFSLQPVLPIGWHFIYHPSVITWERASVDKAFHRAENLNIVTEHLHADIDFSLLK